MSKVFKRTLAMILMVVMVIGVSPLSGFVGLKLPEKSSMFIPEASAAESSEEDSLVYGTDGIITRAEWLHNLAVVFEMSVENEEYPDNYFSDLESTNEYYYDVLLNVQFGVVDVEAGGEVKPDEIATREFATHTLNFCLGYQLEETEYTFSDSDDCIYPADAQIAVNRSWVALIDGKFMPSQAVTSSEVTAMLNDAAAVLGTTVAEENYDSEYIIDSSYVEIPDGTEVTVDSETSTIIIVNSPETISAGDGFVIYQNSIANAFVAENVSVNESITTITYSDIIEDDAFDYVDAQGIVDADFNTIEAYDDTEIVYVDDETGDEYETQGEVVALYAARGVKEFNKTFKANRELDFGTGIKASVSVTMKNPKVVYGIKTFEGEAFAYLEGDVSVSYSIKYDAIADLSKACGLDDIRLVNLTVPGVGGFVISVDISAEGSLSGVNAGTLKTGVQFADKTLRLIKDFKSKDFTLSLEIKATLGLQAKFGLTDLPVLKGYVYAKIGMTGGMKFSVYSGNVTPKECRHFSAHLYASAGATVSVSILIYKESYDISHTIFDEDNSPVKIAHHYEDGKKVYKCTHGTGTIEGDNGYRTPSNSKYNDAGWYGKSSSTGYDSNGNPVTIYTYTLDEDNNATITSYTGNATALNIPEKIDGYTVVGIGNSVFEGNTNLRSVVMSDEIITISNDAFRNCYNLSEIILSKNLFEIGSAAFKDCVSLNNILIPKSVEKVGVFYYYEAHGPFDGCVNLRTIKFEKSITKIPAELFNSCEGLRTVTIPDSVTEIGDSAFAQCENLTSVSIPDSVKTIGSHTFAECSNLSNTNLPKYLVSLGGGAFKNCTSLKEIFIPKSLENVGVFYYYTAHGPFDGCVNLNVIKFEENITKIPSDLFNSCEGLRTVVIPDSVTEIGDSAFAQCENLTSVSIPDSVKTIGSHTFAECSNLSNTNLPKYLVSLGGGAFKNCTSLKEIFIPKSLENVGVFYYYTAHGPFDGCVNLNVIEFEDDITKIPDQLFNSCEGLLSVTIPNSVVEIGDSSFAQCNNLTSVSIPESVVTIANYAFAECVSLSSVSLPSHLEYLGNASFLNCASIVRIDIPMPIECIRDDTFSGCLLLEKITLTNNVREIKSFAFRNCQSLVEIEIPKDVTYIAKEAFYGCSTLTKINIHENIINIGESAFENCTSLQQVSMTNSVTEIGNTAFKGCTALTNIELSSKLTTINDSLFADCSSLEEIVIPKGVTKINKNAFLNCVSLKKITIPVTVTSIDSTSLSYPDRTVIYGCVGSYAETYANEYGFEFVDITKHITGLILKDNDEEKITIDRGYYVTPEFEYLPADTTDVITLTSNDTSIVTVDGSRLYGKNNGSATVTATTTGGLEYTFDVYVHTLNSISVSSQPIKTSYKHGEELDLTGLGITASYGDGTSNTITEYTVSGYDPNVYGAQTVTISYNDKEVTFTVEVIDDRTKLTSIAITTLPSKVAYNKGESFDPTGMVVTGYYSDGTSAPVTGYTVSAMNSLKTGTQTLTVTYEEFTATFTVTVGMATVTLSSVSIKTLPNKVVYIVGESFDTSGLILVANYSDGSTKEVSSGYSVGGFSSSSVGTKTITVTYEGKSTTFNVTVKENEPVVKDVYTITFNSNGGSAVNPITAEEGSQISAPTNPTKTGYTFAGWTDVNGESVSVPSTMPSYNTTLYAKWAVNSYTVTWIVDDETTEENYKFGATINEPAEPAKEGYKFVDWTPAIPDTMPAYGLTFTAVFDVLPNEPDFNKACPDCGESFNNEDEYNRHVSEHGGDENEEDFEFEIRTPSIATVNYGDSLMLHADVTGTLPEDFYIGWSTNNEHFTVDISGKGSVCTISPASSGETEFTATVYDKDGNVVCSDTQKVASKAGFFHKIIAFFKGLFGLTKDYEW